jgi:neutral ceramidase
LILKLKGQVEMKTGFGRMCITPPPGVQISGYYEERIAKGVLDELYVSTAAFDDGEHKAVILSVDTLQLSSSRCDAYRKQIAKTCNINPNSIFINCSHTHTGPLIGPALGNNTEGDIAYEQNMIVAMCKAVEKAFNDLKESKFYVADGKAENISFVRRYRMKNGNVQTNPGVCNENIAHPLGTVNEKVKLLKIERESADDIYIVNFGTHADTIGGEYISGDWPGFVRETIEKVFDNVKCVFLTGAQGDVNHINPTPTPRDRVGLDYNTFDGVPRSYEHAKHMGRVVAGAVLQICGKAIPVNSDKIAFDTVTVEMPSNAENDRYEEAEKILKLHLEGRDSELPYEKMELTTAVAEAKRIVALKDGPQSYFYTLVGLKLGDVVFVGTPGELFTEIGVKIQNDSPFDNTFVCCLTNGGDTYFPTSSAYDEGGYEARTSFLKKGGDEIIIKGIEDLFEKINC